MIIYSLQTWCMFLCDAALMHNVNSLYAAVVEEQVVLLIVCCCMLCAVLLYSRNMLHNVLSLWDGICRSSHRQEFQQLGVSQPVGLNNC